MGNSRISGWKKAKNKRALLPIEWVERILEDSPPRGCVPSPAGQNRREQPGSRSGCLASARHRSLTPCAKPNPSSHLDNSIMIRRKPMEEQPPHYVPPGTGCAPGALPDSPLGSLPAADGKSTEFTRSTGRRSNRRFTAESPEDAEKNEKGKTQKGTSLNRKAQDAGGKIDPPLSRLMTYGLSLNDWTLRSLRALR